MDYKQKYIKYKQKYLKIKNQLGSGQCLKYGLQQHFGECWHDAITMLMFQSDVLNKDDEYITYIKDANINKRYEELKIMFSLENIDKNCYKLPFYIYLYYINNNSDKIGDTMIKISKFLEISQQYMLTQQKRIQNRIENDDILKRYETEYLLATYSEEPELIKKYFEKKLDKDFLILEKKFGIDKFIEILEKDPFFPDRDYFLSKLKIKKSTENKEENKQYMEIIENYFQKKISQIEKKRKIEEDESTIDKKTKFARRNSFSKSLECTSYMLQISRLFDYKKVNGADNVCEDNVCEDISKGANMIIQLLTIETINLYVNKYNLRVYMHDISKSKKNYIETLENFILNDNLVGILGILYSKYGNGGYHMISFYKCGENQIIYNDNILPIIQNWKVELIECLKNYQNIFYMEDENVLNKFSLFELNKNIRDKLKVSGSIFDTFDLEISEKIDNIFEKDMNIYKEMKNRYDKMIQSKPELKGQITEISIPERKDIKKTYVSTNLYLLNYIQIIMKTQNYSNEYEYILNYLTTDYIFMLDNINNMILRIFNILHITNKEEVLKLIDNILSININIDYINISDILNISMNKNIILFNEDSYIMIIFLNKYPEILKKKSFFDTFNYYLDISIYILFLNNIESEKYLDKLNVDIKNNLLIFIKNIIEFKLEFYILINTQIIKTSIIDAKKKINLENHTNSKFKKECIDLINQNLNNNV